MLQDPKVLPALLLTFLSGVSTAVGGLIVCMFGVQNSKLLGKVVSFASGVMIYISFMDLLPEANMTVGFGWSNIFVCIFC
jgi:zinc transporter, ZIP family